MSQLRQFWFKFALSLADPGPPGILLGVGVTAHSREDAVGLIRDRVFAGQPLPRIQSVLEDVEFHDLNQNHVVPNMGNRFQRGIWFPRGYE